MHTYRLILLSLSSSSYLCSISLSLSLLFLRRRDTPCTLVHRSRSQKCALLCKRRWMHARTGISARSRRNAWALKVKQNGGGRGGTGAIFTFGCRRSWLELRSIIFDARPWKRNSSWLSPPTLENSMKNLSAPESYYLYSLLPRGTIDTFQLALCTHVRTCWFFLQFFFTRKEKRKRKKEKKWKK